MPKLELYYTQTCPYCHKVLRFMTQNNISLTLKDTGADSRNREELIRIGGMSQVPCLVIDGQAMYESDDIIEWLRSNYKK